MTVAIDELISQYPTLYHMAAKGSWPSIQRFGLLSTSRLLDLFEIHGEQRWQIEAMHRPENVVIQHDRIGVAVVRDQKPMSDSGLMRALQDGLTPREWYKLLNRRVFFWLTRDRLVRLLKARAYRDDVHTVLEVDARELLNRHADRVNLCALNSGCTKPMPHPRGRDTFLPLSKYPFHERRGSGDNRVVELSVLGGVPDIAEYTLRVVDMQGDREVHLVWSPRKRRKGAIRR